MDEVFFAGSYEENGFIVYMCVVGNKWGHLQTSVCIIIT